MIVGACSYHSFNVYREQYVAKCGRGGKKCQYLILGVIIKNRPKTAVPEPTEEKPGQPLCQDTV